MDFIFLPKTGADARLIRKIKRLAGQNQWKYIYSEIENYPELIKHAIQCGGDFYENNQNLFYDDYELALCAVKAKGSIYMSLPYKFQCDETIASCAVKQNYLMFAHLPVSLGNNYECCVAALVYTCCGKRLHNILNIPYRTPIKDLKEFILTGYENQYRMNAYYFPKDLLADKEFVMKCCQYIGIFRHISSELKHDKEVILHAMKYENIFEHLPRELMCDDAIQRLSFGLDCPNYFPWRCHGVITNFQIGYNLIRNAGQCFNIQLLSDDLFRDRDIICEIISQETYFTMNKILQFHANDHYLLSLLFSFKLYRPPSSHGELIKIFNLQDKITDKVVLCISPLIIEELKYRIISSFTVKMVGHDIVFDFIKNEI